MKQTLGNLLQFVLYVIQQPSQSLTIYRNRLTETDRKKGEGQHEVSDGNREREKERKTERKEAM
jgi:hypothetical protein